MSVKCPKCGADTNEDIIGVEYSMSIDHKFDWPNDNDKWREKIHRDMEKKL